MSSVSRDEGGRSRRRRRRGTSSAPSNTNLPSTRSNPPFHPNSSSHNRRSNHSSHRSSTFQQQQQYQQQNDLQLQQQKELRLEKQRQEDQLRIEREKKQAQEAEEQKLRQQRLEHAQKRFQQRQLNLSYTSSNTGELPATERLSDSQLRQLDSSLRKCTGFLRKIRSTGVTEDTTTSLTNEAKSLNLSRYISEVIAAVSESKIRSADVDHVLTLCGELHRRYEDFSQQFATTLANIVINPTQNATQRDLISRKSAIRLLVEMILLGMITDVSLLSTTLKQLVRSSKDKKDESTNNLTIIVSFIRAGARALLPHVTLSTPSSSENPQSSKNLSTQIEEYSWENDIISDSTKNAFSSALQSYYTSEVTDLLKEAAAAYTAATSSFNRSTQIRGTPDDATASSFESAKQQYEKILSSATTLAEALGITPFEPEVYTNTKSSLPTENTVGDSSQILVGNSFVQSARNNNLTADIDNISETELPFENEEQRLFYTELPVISNEATGEAVTTLFPSGSNDELKHASRGLSVENVRSASQSKTVTATRQGFDSRKKGFDKVPSLDKLLAKLSSAESKENTDAFVINYIAAVEGSKNSTKKLIKVLCAVPPQKLNLLPAYARIAASLKSLFNEVPVTVATSLEDEFRLLVGKPDVDEKSLVSCTRTAKYIGEYVKFGLIDTSTVFDLMSICMKDFTGHRVDTICHLLESCGRYVYRTPSSHLRMANVLEKIWRIKSVRNLEARHNALVESAFFAARGSLGNKVQKKTRPPLHEYIRHLIYYRLDASNIKWTLHQLLKLPWDDSLEQYVIKKFVKISRARFSTIPYVSTLVLYLQKHKPTLVIGIVDALLEAIRSGMEKNDGRDSQRRIAEMHLLGEMYKCNVVDEKLIYNVLYQLVLLKSENLEQEKQVSVQDDPQTTCLSDQSQQNSQIVPSGSSESISIPDPPGDFFRIHLVCVLVESCGRILVASNRRKLEVFWIFFERYLFYKTAQAGLGDSIPIRLSHVVSDVFEHVLIKPKKLGKDLRSTSRGSASTHETLSSRHLESRDTINGKENMSFARCWSLEKAIDIVNNVRKSPADAALVCFPIHGISDMNHIEKPDGIPLKDSGRETSGSAQSDNRGNSSAIIIEPRQDPRRLDENEINLQDSSSNDSFSNEFDEDGVEHLFSGDDRDAEDQLVNGTHDHTVSYGSEDETESQLGTNGNDRDEDEEDEEEDDDDDEEEEIIVGMPSERAKTEEEEAFAKELAAFTAESVQSARSSSSRVTKFDRMAIPMSLMAQKMEEEKAAAAAQAAKSMNGIDSESDSDSGTRKKSSITKSVEFKMLVRRGGKSQLHGLQVPQTSSLAVAAKKSETADAARHEETKRLVLESTIVMNDDTDDLEDEVPLRAEQHAREREESIRRQRSQDQMELLSTLARPRNRR